jgi:serine/threonine-protein kinase
VFADKTAAWDGAYPDRPDLAIRVEAASYRGRPVYFRITHPDWGEPPPDRTSPLRIISRRDRFAVVFGVVAGVLIAALLIFAVRNVRRGRADLRGAVILAATVIALIMVFKLLAATHFSDPGQVFPQFVLALEPALFAAGFATAGYLALEPVMRRRSPHRLTAWTRLTGGRWRDPLVGRDVLIGVLVGVACSLDQPTLPFYPSHLGPTVVNPDSFIHPVGDLADLAAGAVGVVLVSAGTFAVVLAVARREWIAFTVLAVIILTLTVLGSGRPSLNLVFQGVRAAVVLFLLMRLGVLAAVACSFAVGGLEVAPLTLDPSAWYFGASLTYLLALVGLAGYAAVVSLGGRRLFREGLFGDD